MIEIDLNIVHHFSSGVYAKQMELPAGHFAITHKHTFDHMSILAKGMVNVTCDGVQETHHAPDVVTIKAGVAHKIHALTDSVWFCVHQTDETDPAKIDHTLIEGD